VVEGSHPFKAKTRSNPLSIPHVLMIAARYPTSFGAYWT